MIFEQSTEIVSNRQLTPDTWLMELKSPDIASDAKPGQFIMVRVRQSLSPLLRRPFSICGIRGETILVLYRIVGEGTRLMTGAEKGDRVAVLGPLGRGFSMPGKKEMVLLVGGGIGVAPLFFLSQVLSGHDLSFMAGFPTADEIVTPEQVGLPPVDLFIATDDGSRGHGGFVTELLEQHIEAHEDSTSSLRILSCGPQNMLRKVAALAMKRGVPCEVSLESHMACGLGACQGCAVTASERNRRPYYHVCQDGPVFPAEAVHWEAF